MKRILLFFGLLAAFAMPAVAVAGTNGQSVYVRGFQQYSVVVCGINQNKVGTCTRRWSTPNYVTYIYGYWWVGGITIFNYGLNGNYLGSSNCYVPKFQPYSDWWPCPGWR